MNAFKNRLKKIEAKAEVINLSKDEIEHWALKHAKESIEATETDFASHMRKAYEAGRIPVPLIFTFPKGEVTKRAKYYTRKYPNLQACINGERRKNQMVLDSMKPTVLALKKSIEKDQGEIKEL